MIQKTLKHGFKILTFLFVLAFFNCQQEDLEKEVVEQETNDSPYRMELVTKDHYNQNPEILNELCKLKAKKPDYSSREIYNSEYDFYVETDNAKYIESTDGSFHSYTFAVVKEDETNVKENLVISLQPDGTYSSQFVEYTFNDNNSYSIRYANIDLDELDYLARTGTASFYYECVTTINYNTTWDPDCSCEILYVLSVNTNCYFTMYQGAGGGNINGSIWTNNPGSGTGTGTSGSTTTSTTTTTSYTEPLFTRPFMGFISGLSPEQQDYLNLIENFQLKLDLRNYFDVNGFTNDTEELANNIIDSMMENNSLTFEEALFINSIVTISPDNPIPDIAEYLECFDISQDATLTIYANEPDPGTGDTWEMTLGGPFVGHTFISISQGNNISTFGYYPEGDQVGPYNPSDVSTLGDDSGDPFSVSISTTISSTQLQQLINFSVNFNSNYNLNTYNCSDFGIEAGNIGGLNLPSSDGNWPNGGGSNPGTLGEHIRNLTPTGNVTVNTTGGNAPNSHKDC